MDPTYTRDTTRNSGSSSSSSTATTATTYALNGKIMLCTVIVIFFAVFVILGFHTYARWFLDRCCRRRRRRHRQGSRLFHLHLHHHSLVAAASRAAQPCVVVPQGLDINILKTLPTFVYSDAASASRDRECPVCLSEFEEGDTGRVLPECKHCFHAECIDLWFYSHSSCPVCRAPVLPGKPPKSGREMVPPDVSGSDPSDRVVVPEPGSPSTSAEKVDGLVSILVEEPQCMEERYKGTENMCPGHTGLSECNRVRSPANRILSMKRIWSI